MELEEEIARAVPPVIDVASDVYGAGQAAWDYAGARGRQAWQGVEAAGEIAGQAVDTGVDQAERTAARSATWAVDRGARAVGAAREAFDWISD